jgi:competence protein ComEA
VKLLLPVLLVACTLGAPPGAASADGAGPPDQGPPTAEQDTRININEAEPAELTKLPGIGPARAEAIVTERNRRRFRRIEDIMRVPGIGRKTFGRIRSSIRVR